MPDYLSCGVCHAEFEVADFYRFLDHKVSNCNAKGYNNTTNNGHNSHNGWSQQTPAARAESVLECSKCLKKCRTPWALLQHLQSDHCLSLARILLLPTDCGPPPYISNSRQRSVEQADTTEACTQTTRSCLRRQVCPYEEGLPEECCLKATREQRASDSGCCCMDSYGSARQGCDRSGGCSVVNSGDSGGGSSSSGVRQTDCCLAVPKKRRLLTAVSNCAASVPSAGMSSMPPPEVCCGLQADCSLQRPPTGPVNRQSVECQTDFVVSLLDFDVDMLLDDAAAAVESTSSSALVDGITMTAASAQVPLSSMSPMSASDSGGGGFRRPVRPAPSKAIQTVSRIALLEAPPPPLQIPPPQMPPPPTPEVLLAVAGGEVSAPCLSAHIPQLPTQQQQQQSPQPPMLQSNIMVAPPGMTSTATFYFHAPVTLPIQYQQNDAASIHYPQLPLPLPPLDTKLATVSLSSDDSEVVLLEQPAASPGVPRLPAASVASNRELKFKCSQCSRSFRQNIHLRKHVMSQHSHSKPHKCPTCDYTTVEKSHLTVHIRKHTGERPYSCRDCDYSTAQNCTLKAHYLRKHPGSVVHCGRCQQEFVTEHERDKHEKNCSVIGATEISD